MSTTNVSDTKLSGQQDLSMEHARSACDSCPSTVRRNSDGDVKSLISNSGDHCTPGSSFRDDTNSDLYLAKSVSCKSCSETNKIPGKGLISQGVLENPHQISDKDGKLSNLLQSDDTDENVFEDDSEQDIKKGAINGSIASSCGTLVEDSDCLKNVSESDVDKYSSNSEKETESDSTTETVRENLVYTNGDCDDLNDARSEISSTFSSYSNDHEDSCGYRSDLQGGFTKKKEFIETVPYNKIKKHLDVDGLAVVVDPVQSRLQELERNYRGQIDELQTQLQTQGCLCEPRLSLNSKQEVVSQSLYCMSVVCLFIFPSLPFFPSFPTLPSLSPFLPFPPSFPFLLLPLPSPFLPSPFLPLSFLSFPSFPSFSSFPSYLPFLSFPSFPSYLPFLPFLPSLPCLAFAHILNFHHAYFRLVFLSCISLNCQPGMASVLNFLVHLSLGFFNRFEL